MAQQKKSKGKASKQKSQRQKMQPQGQKDDAPKKKQSNTRRVFTIVISVIVVLGLMIPVAGIGFASCGAHVDNPTGVEADPAAPQDADTGN